jgi:hypothetical protein
MPSKFNSTAKKPGKAVKKPYNRGGRMRRNLRDEEARVIGVQDDAADELRRVRARRPHDAKERADKRAELARVGARGRDARDEMHRLRDKAVGLGLKRGGRTKADTAKAKAAHKRKMVDAQKRIARTDAEIALPRAKNVRNEPPRRVLKTGGRAKKQGYNDRLDESLGMRNRKTKAAPKKKAPARKAKAGLSNKINQHKRMAMGEDVLTGRMLKTGGKAVKKKTGGRVVKKKTGGQTLKSRRKESEGAEKAAGRRKYAAVGTMDKGDKKLKRGGRTAADSTGKGHGSARKYHASGGWQREANRPGGSKHNPKPVAKKRGGRTAADSDKSKAAHSKSSHKYFAGASKNPKRVGRSTGGRAPATTGVRLNMGAPKSKTIKARGMGAATRGGQFRTNT